MTSSPPVTVARPAERYGESGRGPRRAAYASVALVAVAALAWVAWAGLGAGSDPVHGQVIGFAQTGVGAATAQLQVEAPETRAAQCSVRALDPDRSVIGRASVILPAGAGTRDTSVALRILTSVSSVEIVTCRALG